MYDTLELVELDVDLERPVPCSGTGHFTGLDKHLHGDPSMPAEWMMRTRCPGCGFQELRPVCDYFKCHGLDPDRSIGCSTCRKVWGADEFFTILWRL